MSSKLLIAIKSCQQHRAEGFHNAIRSTWGRDLKPLGIDLKFFMGKRPDSDRQSIRYENDEVVVKAADDYNSLPFKTREICRWASGKKIDHVFLADNDTFLIPKKMLESGFDKADYAGRFNGNTTTPLLNYRAVGREGQVEYLPTCYPWASGGYGYFLSQKSLSEISFEHPNIWAEDLWVGQVLGPFIAVKELKVLDTTDMGYSFHFPAHQFKQGYTLELKWMEQMYKEHQ